ncbi:hypothetical protein ACFOWZ_40195 [Lentzea rhizosphaerae]|uniref:WXG100 family type VII secretion target n=1 Tax=Lentzea rhizosphaerae TaxID=2041025 RepID=A0ABV8C6V2_9PSEU
MRGPNSAAEEVRVSAVIGSDPDQLDQLAATMLACADRLDGVRSELAFVLAASPWQGGDADDFRWQWGHQLAGLLQGASTAFREAGARVRGDAGQQRQASADDGAGAGAPSAGRAGGGADSGGFDPLGSALWLGGHVLGALGFGAGAAGVIRDANRGLLRWKWTQTTAHEVIRLGDAVRVGDAVPLRTAGKLLGKFALPIDVLNTVSDGFEFADEAGKDVTSQETFNAGVSTVLGAVGVGVGVAGLVLGAPAVAPVAAGLFVGTVLWEAAVAFTPAEEWLHDGLWGVADGVGKAADGVGDIINGGLNALLGR